VLSIGGDLYTSWDNFKEEIIQSFSQIHATGIFGDVLRAGLRYINFFDGINIYDNIKLQILNDNEQTSSNATVLRMEIPRTNACKFFKSRIM
jgi:uncharacterized protein (TIGR04255 family)